MRIISKSFEVSARKVTQRLESGIQQKIRIRNPTTEHDSVFITVWSAQFALAAKPKIPNPNEEYIKYHRLAEWAKFNCGGISF